MSAKDTSSLRLKKRRRPTELSKSIRDGDSEETRLFLTWLSKYYEDFSAGILPTIDEFLWEDNGETTFLHSQSEQRADSQNKLTVYYDPKTLTVMKLSCIMNGIQPRGFQALRKTINHCSYLSVLQLDFCDLTTNQVESLRGTLKRQPAVTHLSLRGNPKCRDSLYLLVNVGVKVLNLKMCQIDAQALRRISEAFLGSSPDAGLSHLDLSSNPLFEESCEHVASILRCDRGLVSLNLSDCKITNAGLEMILESFRRFQLRGDEILLRRRLRLEYYRMLYQSGASYRTDIEQIVETHPFTSRVQAADGKLYCSGNDTLESLNLAYNAITDWGTDMVMRLLLESGSRLTRIGLEGNAAAATAETGLDARKSSGDSLRVNGGRKSAGSVRSKGSLRRRTSGGRASSASPGLSVQESK